MLSPGDMSTPGPCPGQNRRGNGVDQNSPVFQAIIAPFVVAFVIAAASRLFGGKRGDLLAGAGVVGAALIGYELFAGQPTFPPPASTQKLFYLIAFGGLVGLFVDLLDRRPMFDRLAIVVVPAVAVLWLAWRQLAAGLDWMAVATILAIWLAIVFWLWRLRDAADAGGAAAGGVLLIAAAIGIAGVAFIAPSATLPLFAALLAAAVGGLALWSFGALIVGGARIGFPRAALLGIGGGLGVILHILVSFTANTNILALAGVALVPFVEPVARRIKLGSGRTAEVAAPVILGIVAAIPAFAAIGLAYAMSAGTAGSM